jgi:Tol biopolymer transport system component
MAALRYLDFDLLIERTGDRYRARVLSSPGGEASADFKLPFSSEQLQIFVLKAISLGTRRRVRRIESPDMREIKTFGRELFEAVFDDEVNNCLRLSMHEAERSHAGLRIRLRLDDSDGDAGVALSDVPWEFMFDSGGAGFLCLSSASPVVRYQDLRQPIEPIAVKPPLRLLVMISAPRDAQQLDVEHEQSKLDEALRIPIEKGLITIDRMEEATLQQLQRRLRVSEYHAFHFIGHGGYDERGQGGVLLLEDDRGRSDPVSAEFLRTLFQNHRTLRLAILNACEGARTDPTDPFAGVAQSLVRGGVAAVIAMQFEISDEAAIILSSEFYSALADGYPVDAALAEARTAVYTRASAVEWAVPVLYLRSPDASIFDVEAAPPVPQIKRVRPPKPPPREGPRSPRGRRAIIASAAALTLILAGAFAVSGVLGGDTPSPSPDGTTPTSPPPSPALLENQVVFVRDGDIMRVDPDSPRSHMVRRGDAHYFAPSISPNGKRILFAAYVDGSESDEKLDVFSMDADGSNLDNLTHEPGVDGAPAWSPDGNRIVFESKRDGDFEIYVMSADGSDPTPLTENDDDDRLPDWSPIDGLIAFESDRVGDKDIWVMNTAGGGTRPLTGEGSDDGAPVWSPEGDLILYRSKQRGDDGHEAWVMNASGSGEHPLTDESGDVRAPAWSPDGSQIVFAGDRDGDGDYDLYLVDARGGEPTPLIQTKYEDERGPTWCCF